MLKHGILGLLNYGDMTGYQIMTVFRDSLSHFWVAQTSQIYRELQVLEKNGWIRSTHVEQESRPDKNELSITEAGRAELHRWLEEDDNNRKVKSPLLMKTFFRGECSIEENIAYFRKLLEARQVFPGGKEPAAQAVESYQGKISDPLKGLYWKFTLDFGEMYEKLLVEWCEHCIRELEEVQHEHSGDQRQP